MKLLNVGCGSTFHNSWVNIDIASSHEIQSHDIRQGIPYPSNYFDACYSSHVIEHLTCSEAEKLLAECFRVVKSSGVIRIVVPDLESIARNYLFALEQVEAGEAEAEPNYDWMMLELYDQGIRTFKGGEIGRFLTNPNIANKDFVLSRIGAEAGDYWQKKSVQKSLWRKIRDKKLYWYIQQFQQIRNTIAQYSVAAIAGDEAKQALQEGLFRNSGEIHQWMYDRFSLKRLLKHTGFKELQVCQANESTIPNFHSYELDVINGKIRKPDSLFVEGIKP